jgi:hypothetical protein
MPAMMSERQAMRYASADPPNTSMPVIMVPAAPIPVHSAYAVPNGTDLSENASRAKLEIIADSIAMVGQNLVKPSENFRVSAQTTSSKPASGRASHAVTMFVTSVALGAHSAW